MAPPTAPSNPGKKGARAKKGAPLAQGTASRKAPTPAAPAKAAVPAAPERHPVDEPVWLVRIVLVLFFVGFAAFLAREGYSFVQSLP